MKTYKRRTIQTITRIGAGLCEHDTKVTRIRDGYNIRILLDGVVNQESRVYNKEHISMEIQDMLRMEDKCGNISGMAGNSRNRRGRKEIERKKQGNQKSTKS